MASTISTYYNPKMKINLNTDHEFNQPTSCLINKHFNQYNQTPNNYQLNSNLNNQTEMSSIRNQTINTLQASSNTKRSHLKQPTSVINNGQSTSTQQNGTHLLTNCSNNYSNGNQTNSVTTNNSNNSITNNRTSTIKREIPRPPNSILINNLSTNSSQPSSLNSSTLSTYSNSQTAQKNSLQSPAFDKSAINGLKTNSSKLQRPLSGNYSLIAQPSSSRSSPIMSTNTKNHLAKQTNLGSTTNLSVKSNSFRSSTRSTSQDQQNDLQKSVSTTGQQKTRAFGLNSKQNSLSKSNLNNRSTSNLNRSNLNLNHTNTLPSLIKPVNILKSNNQTTNLSGSTIQLTDTKNRTSSLIKPKNLTTVSCLPAPKSRPTSAYLPTTTEALNNNIRSRSKLPSSSNSRTSSNLNLNEQTNLVKPLNTIKTTKDSLNALKKKPTPSNSIRSTMQNLSQSSSNSMIYKPYSTLTNRSPKLKLNGKDSKIDNSELDAKNKSNLKGDLCGTKFEIKKDKSLIKLNFQNTSSSDKCIARVSPIRRQYTMSNNIKRQLNGSLNSSDQEEDELDDDLFDNENSLNQQTSEDTNSFNSEEARYYAVLSSSEDEKLLHGSRSREREEKRLRRASGQRSCSSKRSSPTVTVSTNTTKTSTQAVYSSNEKLNNNLNNKDLTNTPTSTIQLKKGSSSNNLLNKSNSSSINTIDQKSTSLNIMFPTLNRLHNSSNSIQQLNSNVNSAANCTTSKSTCKKTDEDYQSDADAELTLYKLKSLDFNCNSSNTYAINKDGNNNSLSLNKSPSNQTNSDNDNSSNSKNNEVDGNHNNSSIEQYASFTTPGLSSLLNNYMSRSIGSLTGSQNKLNSFNNPSPTNWSSNQQDSCSTPPTILSTFRSKSPNLLANNSNNIYQNLLTTTAQSSFQPYSSFLSSPLQSNSTANTVINNNVQNTTINVPVAFTSRLTKYGENRGSSLSLISACSSNYSNNLSVNSNQTNSQNQQRPFTIPSSNSFLDKGSLIEIKHLKNELNRANQKIFSLESQLITPGQMANPFEQILQTKTLRAQYAIQLEKKDREIEHLKMLIENLSKTYGFNLNDLNYNFNESPTFKNEFNLNSSLNNSPNLHHSRSLNNGSDCESVSLRRSKSKQNKQKSTSKKRSCSKKSRTNSIIGSSDDEDTASLASVHSKDGTLNGNSSTTGWFKNSITRAFKKKNSNRSKHGSNQELDKTGDLNDNKYHPQHPSQLHQSYIKQDCFKQDLFSNDRTKENEVLELKAQLIEKEKCLTDERLLLLSKEDEMMKLKDCLNHLQQELFSLKKNCN